MKHSSEKPKQRLFPQNEVVVVGGEPQDQLQIGGLGVVSFLFFGLMPTSWEDTLTQFPPCHAPTRVHSTVTKSHPLCYDHLSLPVQIWAFTGNGVMGREKRAWNSGLDEFLINHVRTFNGREGL